MAMLKGMTLIADSPDRQACEATSRNWIATSHFRGSQPFGTGLALCKACWGRNAGEAIQVRGRYRDL